MGHQGASRLPKRWCGAPTPWACHLASWGPRASSRPLLYTRGSVSQKNICHIFPKIYRGGGGGESPLLLRERADPAAPTPPERRKSKQSSPALLLGVGGGISITIYISTITISITISEIHFIPLIVCDRLNPGYCFSAICMFVIGILSLFGGEIELSDCVVIHMPLIHIIFHRCE